VYRKNGIANAPKIRVMKTTNLLNKKMRSCFILLAFALALPNAVALAERPSSSAPKITTGMGSEETNKVTGKITRKTNSAIAVGGKMIALNPATTLTKGGEAITLQDLNIGDQVSVVVAQTDNGDLQAVTIEVVA
jgi:hypothetical protein